MNFSPDPLDNFGGAARLFPLPNLVLFPHVLQALHVFEPRYRQLLADSLADDRLIALVLLRPGWEKDYHLRPALHPIVCLGRVCQAEKWPDGRSNLLLRGLRRARVAQELPDGKLYRTAEVTLLEDVPVGCPATEEWLRQQLGDRMRVLFGSHPGIQQLERLLASQEPLGSLCDVFSYALPLEFEVKQQLLAEVSVEQRGRRLVQLLDGCSPQPTPATASGHYPPGFSAN